MLLSGLICTDLLSLVRKQLKLDVGVGAADVAVLDGQLGRRDNRHAQRRALTIVPDTEPQRPETAAADVIVLLVVQLLARNLARILEDLRVLKI